MARETLSVRYVNADDTNVYVSLVNTSDLDKISQFTKIDIEGIQGSNYTFTPPFQTSGRNIVLNNTAGVPTGYFSGMTVYVETGVSEQIEWRKKSSANSIPFTSSPEYDETLTPEQSYTKQQGINQQVLITWEEKYVNGISTGETRNRQEIIQTKGQPEIKVIGTKSDITEWKPKSETKSIPFRQSTEEDNTLTPEESYIKQNGINKEILVTWEEEYINGVSTGNTRNRSEVIQTSGRDEIKVIGTKVSSIAPLPENKIDYPNVSNKIKVIEYKNAGAIYFGTLEYLKFNLEPYTFSFEVYNDSLTDISFTQLSDGNKTYSITPILVPSKKWVVKSITFTPENTNSTGITLNSPTEYTRVLIKNFQLVKGENAKPIEMNSNDSKDVLNNLSITSTKNNADLKIVKDALVATATKDEVTQTLNNQLQPIKTDVNQNKSNLSVLSDQVSSKVSKNDYTVDQNNIVTRLNNAESARVQLANQISDKVTTTQLSTSMQSAKDYIDKNQKSNELRMNKMETSINQNGQAIQLKASQQDFNASRKTLSQVISEISATTKGINLSYDENGNIQSYTMDKNGIQLRGDKVDITVNKDFNVMASKVDDKVGKNEIINRLNLSPEGLDINVNNMGIRGGNNSEYIDIRNTSILSYGSFTRTWANVTDTAKLKLGMNKGTIQVSNIDTGYNLYLTEKGLSTMLAGAGDETAGTLEFHSTKYNDNSRGVRLHSTYGAVALESDYSRIILNANLTVNIESNYGIYFRPYRDNRTGNNEFAMYVKQNDSGANTDGVIKYGNVSNDTSEYGSGLRFSKSSVKSIIYATNKDGDIGTGDFYGDKIFGDLTAKGTNLYALVAPKGELRVTDSQAYNNGNPNYQGIAANEIRAGSIKTLSGNFYIGIDGSELRVTSNSLYNGGNPNYKDIRFGKWYAMSSEKYKYDINEWNYSVLDAYRNDLKLYSYKYKTEKDSKYIRNHHGVIIERELPIEWRHGDGFDGNEVMFWNTKAIQELIKKVDTLEEKLNEQSITS
ncbi:G5 domain-containing protein [Staphylococcus hominis]|uniref:G5 domain-containing protein n=1 Tax=Staphylococcus hominis TaxID=1290 RepID=UPI0028783729|nr:G5 domain-containing protein [Staphylococcus hominis]MDS3899893.1 G5 domain-containing protein [Staphylococcus hominis]MDS3899956.1 G5 domain-containing protein [Staphylococcus hominis]